jgi:N-acetylglucosaminyldiphosphoundecaprenol N-acetyl-beta-D-mannosaminyltransferase
VIPRFRLLGGNVDAMERTALLERLWEWSAGPSQRLVFNHNLHSLACLRRDPSLRELWSRADLTYIDGMALVAWGRCLGLPLTVRHRHTSLDFYGDFFTGLVERRRRLVLVGGNEPTARRCEALLRKRFRGLEAFVVPGYFDATAGSAENVEKVGAVRALRPNVLALCMGMPRQERWAVAHGEELGAALILTWGAFVDYLGGAQRIPPRFNFPIPTEWAFRFARAPRRLGYRYLVEPWTLLPEAWRDLTNRGRLEIADATSRYE